MRIGVIGLGVIAPFFLRAIESDDAWTLTAVCDRNPDKLSAFVDGGDRSAAGIATFADHRELLGSGLVDAVVVTLPNEAHAPVVEAALRAQLHVCCEKPLTTRSTDAQALAEDARRNGRTLFTAFHRRYNHNLREFIRQFGNRSEIDRFRCRYLERIEEHTGAEAWYLDLDRCGGGCVIDNGPNALDMVRSVFGELKVVDATIGDVRDGVEFCASIEVMTADGIRGSVELDWALDTGEVKDLSVHRIDGSVVDVDLLSGFDGFKASLHHEYSGILTDFTRAIDVGPQWIDEGPTVTAMVEEIYQLSRSKQTRLRMPSKAPAAARLVKLLFHRRDDRGMTLSPWESRCVRGGDLHELVTTTDRPSQPGDRIESVGFLGFVEFASGTVVERGDELWWEGRRLGAVAGFDECHAPNHYNVLIDVDRIVTAEELGLRVGDEFRFVEVVL